jgi:hypothetical protein
LNCGWFVAQHLNCIGKNAREANGSIRLGGREPRSLAQTASHGPLGYPELERKHGVPDREFAGQRPHTSRRQTLAHELGEIAWSFYILAKHLSTAQNFRDDLGFHTSLLARDYTPFGYQRKASRSKQIAGHAQGRFRPLVSLMPNKRTRWFICGFSKFPGFMLLK